MFSEEKVEELVVFVINGGPDMMPEMVKGSPEMLPEILKEAAVRIKFCDRRPGGEPSSNQCHFVPLTSELGDEKQVRDGGMGRL